MASILIPPLGLLMVGKPVQAGINLLLLLTLVAWPLCAIWAVCVVAVQDQADQAAQQQAMMLMLAQQGQYLQPQPQQPASGPITPPGQ